jgi:hypothetical protein
VFSLVISLHHLGSAQGQYEEESYQGLTNSGSRLDDLGGCMPSIYFCRCVQIIPQLCPNRAFALALIFTGGFFKQAPSHGALNFVVELQSAELNLFCKCYQVLPYWVTSDTVSEGCAWCRKDSSAWGNCALSSPACSEGQEVSDKA